MWAACSVFAKVVVSVDSKGMKSADLKAATMVARMDKSKVVKLVHLLVVELVVETVERSDMQKALPMVVG